MNRTDRIPDRILPDAIRRIVIHRAVAGSYDPHETHGKAIDGARAAARRSLGKDRLTHREAVEVDALVIQARDLAARGELASLFRDHGDHLDGYVVTQGAERDPGRPSRDTSLILAALAQVYQVMLAILAVVRRTSPSAPAIEAPVKTLHALPQPSFAMVRAASSTRPS